MKKDYNLGLDIGTSSVGWAVVEVETQKILRKGNKRLWGVRLFEPATTAETRRNFRGTRRRYDRRRERIQLLREEFKDTINQLDNTFYQKLDESFYNELDLVNKKCPLSKDEKLSIKKYYELYPTIYHLRKKLIENKEQEDIRLVYLAIHHIIKYRGNFLYDAENFSASNLDISSKLESLLSNCMEVIPELNEEIYGFDIEKICSILLISSKNDRKIGLKNELSLHFPKYFIDEFTKMINGNVFSFSKMLDLDVEEVKLNFSSTEYDDKFDEYSTKLNQYMELFSECKEFYDTLFLKRLFRSSGSTGLSSLMVEKYTTHKNDLKFLKNTLDYNRKLYRIVFKNDKNGKDKCLYEKYIHNQISNDDFCKEIQKYINKSFDSKINETLKNQYTNDVQKRILNGQFLPRITDTENGKYPFQLNKEELMKIIENQGKYYPFLLNKTNNNKYRLVKLLEFKIPYYIGPLVDDKHSSFAWMERKQKSIKITPYNFDEVVDKELTAEKFIKRMISHCTYLLDEEAMPTNSILYSKFKVLNELKQIKINGEKLSNEIQQKIYKELFLKRTGTITDKIFKEYIHSSKEFDMYMNDINIQGYSAEKKFANNMQSYIDFFGENGIFKDTNYSIDDAEKIIEWVTIFEDKDILKNKILNEFNKLSDLKVQQILQKKYKGWSGLSRKLLTQKYYVNNKFEEKKSILNLMIETDKNFMQIINDDTYKFQDMIASLNHFNNDSKISYNVIEKLATSPATKRGIYQALKIVEEIVGYIGYEPKNIMIEMARGDEKKERKDNKKQYLIKIYENAKKDIENYNYLKKELLTKEKINQKLFLYFIQEGKSLYSGKPLDINCLDEYEIDHIIPRTLIKDDSIDNKALVLREENQLKAASFVLPEQYRKDFQRTWWQHLKKIGLMSNKKLYALTRRTYNHDDIEGFINRQLVETRQITKHVANILSNYYKSSKIIYLHANLSHNYRDRYELYKFRDINDYHHAHDAYLTSILGEYKEKFLKRKIDLETIKELNYHIYKTGNQEKLRYGYVINSLDTDFTKELNRLGNVCDDNTGEILFDADKFNEIVTNNLLCNDVLISKKTEIRTGEFYNQTKNKKGMSGVPLKKNMPTELYGSYTRLNPSYAILISYSKKGKYMKRLVGIPIYYIKQMKSDESIVESYLRNLLNLTITDIVTICSKPIPFYSLLNWNNQVCYLTGASDKVEVCNAKQFHFSKSFYIDHKKALYKLFINKKYDIDVDFYDIQLEEIIQYIVKCIEKEYELYSNLIYELKTIVCYDNMKVFSVEQKENIILQLMNLLKCNSMNANFKFLNSKYSSAFGKKNGRIIEKAIIINTSITGIKQSKIEVG